MDDFIVWFQHHGGALDTSVISITDFPGSGRGAIAVKDIPVRSSLLQFDQWVAHLSSHRKTTRFSRYLVH